MKNHIEVWSDEGKWVVSLCEPDGDEIKVISVHDAENEACEAASAGAQKLGVGAYERNEHGTLTKMD